MEIYMPICQEHRPGPHEIVVECPYCVAEREAKALRARIAELEAENTRIKDILEAGSIHEFNGKLYSRRQLEDENERQKGRIAELVEALRACERNDKTAYEHHEPRPDGKKPSRGGGTIWMTPKEIANEALRGEEVE